MFALNNSTGCLGRLIRIGLSGALLSAVAVAWAGPRSGGARGSGGQHSAGAPRGGFSQPQAREAPPHGGAQGPATHQESRPEPGTATRPGQQHLPDWWQTHRGLSPQQQEDALRREPGFRNLPEGQQQRLINRLHSFDQRPPQQQQRMLGRVEMFERLSPERQQEVRGASQALGRMSPDRQAAIRHAFQQLRGMPPEERQRMLGSSYGAQFSPQERTVLSNFLSVEPYQPHVIQPYFGR